jgi:hypothetical protein
MTRQEEEMHAVERAPLLLAATAALLLLLLQNRSHSDPRYTYMELKRLLLLF